MPTTVILPPIPNISKVWTKYGVTQAYQTLFPNVFFLLVLSRPRAKRRTGVFFIPHKKSSFHPSTSCSSSPPQLWSSGQTRSHLLAGHVRCWECLCGAETQEFQPFGERGAGPASTRRQRGWGSEARCLRQPGDDNEPSPPSSGHSFLFHRMWCPNSCSSEYSGNSHLSHSVFIPSLGTIQQDFRHIANQGMIAHHPPLWSDFFFSSLQCDIWSYAKSVRRLPCPRGPLRAISAKPCLYSE